MADQRDLMVAQLVDAFMESDWPRYQEALAWLRDFVDAGQMRRGKVRHGSNWFDPQVYQQWCASLERARSNAPSSVDSCTA